MVDSCPISTYGSSTAHEPIQVRISHELLMYQNNIWDNGLNLEPTLFLKNVKAGRARMTKAITSANAPPNLLGTDRRIAYNHRKYHSG